MTIEQYTQEVTKDNILQSPADVVLDGVIINIQKGLTNEFILEKYHQDFDSESLTKEQLSIDFEVSFEKRNLKGNDRMNFYAEPLSNTSMAKFLLKYEAGLKVGTKIKVSYNSKGFGKISLN